MKMINLPLTLVCFATLGLAVACGRGDSNNTASIKTLRQEEVIGQSIKESFPGYAPEDPENIQMAARFLGATLENKGQQAKTAKSDAMMNVRIGMLLGNPDEEITAEGTVSEGAAIPLDLVKMEEGKEVPSGYSITARCLPTSGCNQVMALLVHEEDIVAGTTTSETQTIVSGTMSLAGGTTSVAAGTGSDAKLVAAGTGSDEKNLEVPVMKPKKQSMVAVLFAVQKDKSMSIVWSASPTIGNYLKGGKRASVADAKAERSAVAKQDAQVTGGAAAATAPQTQAQAQEGGKQDAIPAVQSTAGAEAQVPSDIAIQGE